MSPVDYSHGRHGVNAPQPALSLWKCPACGAEQTGRPELGCGVCGGGKPGEHVGVPPPVARSAVMAPGNVSGREGVANLTEGLPSDLDHAFLEWIRPFRGKFDSATENLLYEAFKAGAIYAAMQTPQAGPPLVGTAESRTIIAALKMLIDEVLPHAQAEIQAGEFLSIPETEALIRRLEQTT